MITTPHTTIKLSDKKAIGLCDRMPDFCRDVGQDRILILVKHGSHLYGTDTPTSDMDIKGVFLPSSQQVLLNKIPKTYSYQSKKTTDEKNTSMDIDIELFSLHYFIELACKGETISIDMLHAEKDYATVWTQVWQELYDMRSRFYTKDMRAFVGYARTQAAKYGIKGTRLDAVKRVLDFCEPKTTGIKTDPGKLGVWWNNLPDGEHIHKLDPNPRDKNNNRIYQVCGKQFLESAPLSHMWLCLKQFYEEYGERARLAQENKGIDWKAVSHAFRAAFQLREIFEAGDLKFPLQSAHYLKKIKKGELPWNLVQANLEIAIADVERLSNQSTLPTHPDRGPINSWLCATTLRSIGCRYDEEAA
jgi:predicted nucleotidyltransferase